MHDKLARITPQAVQLICMWLPYPSQLFPFQMQALCMLCLLSKHSYMQMPIVSCTTQHRALQDIQLRASTSSISPPGSNILSDVLRVIEYLPQALLYIAHNCKHLRELSLKLFSQATANSRGSVWDHPSLLKRPHFRLSEVWSHCTRLHSLTLVNVPGR